MRIIGKLAAAGLLMLGFEGCASTLDYSQMPRETGRSVVQDRTHKPMQCVPYAREHSGIRIFGDATTWWDQAAGHYSRVATPQAGTVMVLHDYAGPDHGHLAVVRALAGPREIRVDHANWLDDGAVYVNDPVMDVSADNDWSLVRVFNIKTGGWGNKVYPVQGFIGTNIGPVAQDESGGIASAVTLAPDIN
jgi:hypothetical protein